jgi:hypothetical protein
MTDERRGIDPHPLRRSDPPQLGEVELVGRLASSDAGFVYAGRLDSRQVAVVVLSEGAEDDSYGRARFVRAVDEEAAVLDSRIIARETDPEVSPWVAVQVANWDEGTTLGRQLLAPVTLADIPHDQPVRGPAYRPHWFQRIGVGRWRVWPLPWPRALTAAGRWTFAASFAVILLIASLALWIAVKIFEDQPPPPQPPAPQPPGQTPPTPTQPTPTIPSIPTPSEPNQTGGTRVPPIV